MTIVDLIIVIHGFWVQGDNNGRIYAKLAYPDHGLLCIHACKN